MPCVNINFVCVCAYVCACAQHIVLIRVCKPHTAHVKCHQARSHYVGYVLHICTHMYAGLRHRHRCRRWRRRRRVSVCFVLLATMCSGASFAEHTFVICVRELEKINCDLPKSKCWHKSNMLINKTASQPTHCAAKCTANWSYRTYARAFAMQCVVHLFRQIQAYMQYNKFHFLRLK